MVYFSQVVKGKASRITFGVSTREQGTIVVDWPPKPSQKCVFFLPSKLHGGGGTLEAK